MCTVRSRLLGSANRFERSASRSIFQTTSTVFAWARGHARLGEGGPAWLAGAEQRREKLLVRRATVLGLCFPLGARFWVGSALPAGVTSAARRRDLCRVYNSAMIILAKVLGGDLNPDLVNQGFAPGQSRSRRRRRLTLEAKHN